MTSWRLYASVCRYSVTDIADVTVTWLLRGACVVAPDTAQPQRSARTSARNLLPANRDVTSFHVTSRHVNQGRHSCRGAHARWHGIRCSVQTSSGCCHGNSRAMTRCCAYCTNSLFCDSHTCSTVEPEVDACVNVQHLKAEKRARWGEAWDSVSLSSFFACTRRNNQN